MARRVFLHVGVMKSATSYLQALFDCNRGGLLDQGVLWAKSSDNFLATDDLLGTRRERPGLEGAWRRLASQIEAHDGDALVSNELLAPINPKRRARLTAALAPAESHVVITARDIARVIPSQWQTGARNRGTVGWREYVDGLLADAAREGEVAKGFWRRQDIAGIVRGWAETVSLDRVTVVTVPPSGVPAETLGERFAAAIGVGADGFEQPPYTNASVGETSAELLRRVNELTGDWEWLEYRWAFKNALARLVLAPRADTEPAIGLGPGAYAWAREQGARVASEVAATGVRVVGDLDDLVPPEAPRSPLAEPSPATDADLVDAAVDGLVGMGALLAEARIEHDALVRALDAWVTDVATDADWAEFEAHEAALGERPSELLKASRFLRWRLAR